MERTESISVWMTVFAGHCTMMLYVPPCAKPVNFLYSLFPEQENMTADRRMAADVFRIAYADGFMSLYGFKFYAKILKFAYLWLKYQMIGR